MTYGRRFGICRRKGRLGTWAANERPTSSTQNRRKTKEYFEDAAAKGYVLSRTTLAVLLSKEGNYDLAIKHWHLSAAAGHDEAIKRLRDCFSKGKLSKPDLEKALRAHKAACDEMNSEVRKRFAARRDAEAGDDELLKHIYFSYYFGYLNAKVKKVLIAHRAGDFSAVKTLLENKIRTNRRTTDQTSKQNKISLPFAPPKQPTCVCTFTAPIEQRKTFMEKIVNSYPLLC